MKNKIMLFGILAIVLTVFAVSSAAALPIPPGKSVIVWLEPDPSSGPHGADVTVLLKMNTSIDLGMFADWIYFDSSCVNITNADFTGAAFPSETIWSNWGDYIKVAGMDEEMCEHTHGELLMVTLTLQCVNEGACTSELYHHPSHTEMGDCEGADMAAVTVWTHGNFSCEAEEETFSKPLAAGWNLISLPLTSSNTSAAKVLETVSYDAVYRYSATAPRGFESVATMDPGVGYFVHVTASGQTWTYNGTAYTSMNVSLEPGLNMVGWLNCSLSITGSDDALSSLDGKYNYVAMFNATSKKFEAYNPHAPSAFNDFTTMERGTGYFISARAGCPRLVKDCL